MGYNFDTSDAEILCAFKPIFDHKKDSETYRVEPADLLDTLEKHTKFKNKINNQTEFLMDDERVDKEISICENKLGLH